MNKLSPVGKVSKLFGLDGGVLINLYDAFPEKIDNEEPLFVEIDGLAVPLFAEYFERRGQKGGLIRFEDIDTPARASELIGHELFVRRKELQRGRGDAMEVTEPAENDGGDLTFDDLAGYRASVSEGSETLRKGVVTAFIDDDFNPLLQLQIDGKEVFIPAADEFIDQIDTISREISFRVPSGLLELYL